MTYTTINTNLLNETFDELYSEGYIYNEPDENGLDMSYGEYAAIDSCFEEQLVNMITDIDDLEKAAEVLQETIENATDDVRLFFALSLYDDFYCYIDEDERTVDLYAVPDSLKEHFDNLLKDYLYYHDYEMAA